MKINYSLVSRALIALLFVVAGYGKLTGFSGTVGYIGSLGVPAPTLVTVLVILIEIPVALLFVWGYRLCTTGTILAVFTALTIALVHNHWPADMIMILKNIAIIGGIMSAMSLCNCGKCPMGKKCEKCSVK